MCIETPSLHRDRAPLPQDPSDARRSGTFHSKSCESLFRAVECPSPSIFPPPARRLHCLKVARDNRGGPCKEQTDCTACSRRFSRHHDEESQCPAWLW